MDRIQSRVAWALVGALSLLLIAALAGVVRGGPLDPPGPVGPTGKTVITSLPYPINQSGSYVLNGNLTGVSGESGITVNAADVTIDLQGFELAGAAGAQSGILGTQPNLAIRNGTIRAWTDGIVASGNGLAVADVVVRGNANFGINAVVLNAAISDCRVESNGRGVSLGNRASVSDCTITANNLGSAGLAVGSDSTISEVVAVANGDDEINAGAGSTLENCVADGLGSAGDGIQVGDDSVVRGCTARSNGGIEILASGGAVLETCNADGGGTAGHGIKVGPHSFVRGCTATNNGGDSEIEAGDGSLVEDCVVDGWNGSAAGAGNGIVVHFDTVVRGCVSRYNDTNGILADGWRNRLEGNTVVNNLSGIFVSGAFKNVGVNNNAADNTSDYAINTSGDNKFYPVFPLGTAPIGAWDNLDQ